MKIDQQKEDLIDIVLFYKGRYQCDFYDEFIEQIQKANQKELDLLEKIVDGWIDY